MPKPSPERLSREKPQVPSAPEPASASAPEGMERARALARCYLPDTVRLLAGIALAPDSDTLIKLFEGLGRPFIVKYVKELLEP